MLNLLPSHAFDSPETVIARKLDDAEVMRITAIPRNERLPSESAALHSHYRYTQNAGFDPLHQGFFTVGEVKGFATRAVASAKGKRMLADGTIEKGTPVSEIGQRTIEIAMSQLGVKEDPIGSNRGVQIDTYLAPTGMVGVPWCAAFASWTDREAGGTLPYSARVANLWHSSVLSGRSRDRSATPEPGWLAIFARAGQDPRIGGDGHMGRVISSGERNITTIDGNHNNEVMLVTRPRSEVLGYIAFDSSFA